MSNKNKRDASGQSQSQAGARPNPESNGGYGRPLGPGGGFGQGGYGGFGTEGDAEQPGGGGYRDGTWGNEHHGGRRDEVISKDAQFGATGSTGDSVPARRPTTADELEASRMDEEGGGSRPRDEAERPGQRPPPPARDSVQPGAWQREAISAGEIMTTDIKTVTRGSTVQEAAIIMKTANCGVVPVVDQDNKLVGLVTDRDIVVRACADGRSPTDTRVSDVMTTDIEAVTPDEEIKDVIQLMGGKQIRRIPVVDKDDRLVGIISMADVANRADADEELKEALEEVSAKRRRPS